MELYDKFMKRIHHVLDKFNGELIEKEIQNRGLVYGLNEVEKREQRIIVSMASYNARYSTIILPLMSILNQTVKPDKIIVWLDEENSENIITKEMEELKQYGIEYQYTTDGLGPHKKYFYAMQEFPKDLIITIDDDLIYSLDMIESLMKYHEKYPDLICARRVHKITFDSNNELQKYMDWKYEYRRELLPSHLLCATGGGGTLYPPNILPLEAFDMGMIKKYCLNADDIWIKVMELLNRKAVVWVKNRYVMPNEVRNSQKEALNSTNTLAGENDRYIRELMCVYPEAFQFLYQNIEK